MKLEVNGPKLISTTTQLDSLVITETGTLSAPAGKQLSLTVDGIHRSLVPGTYTGDIVLTVTEGFGRTGGFGPPGAAPTNFTAAIRGERGAIIPEKSVLAAVSGPLQGSDLQGLTIRSEGNLLGGLDLKDGSYTVRDTDISLNGYGGNDFSGMGAAVAISGDAQVEIDGLRVHNTGVIRSGLIVTDDAKVTIRNTEIVCMGGDEAQYQAADADVGGMLCVPWQLGLEGNCRATSVLTRASVDYENCKIQSYGWGALSVDGTASNNNWDEYSIHLGTKNCQVDILGPSGYGAFSIGPCRDVFEDTVFQVPDYALIQANETASASYLRSTVHSGRFGVMSYANQGGALELRDSTFDTQKATFLIKGCYPQITVERSELRSAEGVIVQMIDCDDPNYGLTGMDLDAQIPEKIAGHDVTKVNYHDFYLYNSLLVRNKPTDVQICFKDMPLSGDFYNAISNTCPVGTYNPDPQPMGPSPEMLEKSIEKGEMAPPPPDEMPNFTKMPSTAYPANLAVTFDHVDYTGRLSAAVACHGVKTSGKANRAQLGVVTNTVCPVVNNGVIVTLMNGSNWSVTGECYLSALHIAADSSVRGAEGKTPVLTVNGNETALVPGDYTGDLHITLR